MNKISVKIGIEIIEDLFLTWCSRYGDKFYPCTALMVELKQSMETFIHIRLLEGKLVGLLTAMNHCLAELVDEDDPIDMDFESV